MNTNISSGKPWTDEELKASVLSYFEMQTKEKYRVVYSKKYYYCILSIVFNRSVKAFEFRMQNISHVLSSMDKEWLSGLAPARNVGANISASIKRIIQSLTSSGLTVTKKPIFDNQSIWISQQREVAALKLDIGKLDARVKLRSGIKVGDGGIYKDLAVDDYIPPISDEIKLIEARFKKSILSFKYFTQILESQKESASFREPIVKQLLESLQRRNGILNKVTQTIYYKNYPRQEEYLFELWKEKKEFSKLLSKYEDSEDRALPISSSNGLHRQITRPAIASRKIVYDEISKENKSIDTIILEDRVNESHDEARIFGLPIARWEKLILEAEYFWDEIGLSEHLPSRKICVNNVFSEKVDGLRHAIHNYSTSKISAGDEVFQAFTELKNQIQSAIGLKKRYRNKKICSMSDEKLINEKNELFRNIWFCIKNVRYEHIDMNIKEMEQSRLTIHQNEDSKRCKVAKIITEPILERDDIVSNVTNKTRWKYVISEAESLVLRILDNYYIEAFVFDKRDIEKAIEDINLGLSLYDLNERLGNEKVFANFSKLIKQIAKLNENISFQSSEIKKGIGLVKAAATCILFLDEKKFLENKQKIEDEKITKLEQKCNENRDNSRVTIDNLLNSLLKSLSDRERNIVIEFHGLLQSISKKTFAEISRNIGVSRERIRQLHNRSMERILQNSLSVDVVEMVKKAFTGISFTKGRMNLYDFSKKILINSSYQFDPLAALEFMLELEGVKDFLAGNIVSTKLFCDKETKIPICNIEFPVILELFYGIGETECQYLNSRFDIILDTDSILDKSIPSSSWRKLEKKLLYDYLRAAEVYDAVALKFIEIVNSVKANDGTISEKAIYPIMSKFYDLHGVRVKGTVHFLAEICGGLSFDSKHFVWIADGFTWEDSEKFKSRKVGCTAVPAGQLSHSNAAHKILLENKRSMSTKEIVRIALERNLIKTAAKNPAGGLNSLIYIEIQKDKELGRESRFRLLEKGIVELTGRGKALYEGDGRKKREKMGHSPDSVKIVSFAHLVSSWISFYSMKERIAIQSVHGIFDNEKTTEEISISEELSLQNLHRLIKRSSLELRQYILKSEYRWCLTELSKIINECGGVAGRNEILTRIPFAIEINEMRAEGVFNLLIAISYDIDQIREGCYYSKKFERKVIKEVWKRVVSIVTPNTGIYFTEAISELCMSNYYFDVIREPGETFISACIRTNPKTIIKDGLIKLRRDSI